MMTIIFKKISPFALGVALLSAQIIQSPGAQAASLGLGGSSDPTLLEPTVPSDPIYTEKMGAAANSPTEVTASAGECMTVKVTSSLTTSAQTEPRSSKPSSLSYQSEKLAFASIPESTVPESTSSTSVPEPVSGSEASEPQLIAQLSPDDDCCEVGGNTTCELAGVPPAVGGGALAGAPLALLSGIPLAAAIPLAIGGGDGSNVPEPSETAGLVAGFGLLGLWASRRLRFGKTKDSDQFKK